MGPIVSFLPYPGNVRCTPDRCSSVMAAGRRNGLLHKNLAEDAEDWLDRTFETRSRIGQGGTTALEQVNHLLASAGFGLAYGVLRNLFPNTSGVAWVQLMARRCTPPTSLALRRCLA